MQTTIVDSIKLHAFKALESGKAFGNNVATEAVKLGARISSDVELRRDCADFGSWVFLLELLFFSLVGVCAIHAIHARRIRSLLSCALFVATAEFMLSAASAKGDGQTWATPLFSASFRGIPVFALAARASVLYLSDSASRLSFSCGWFTSPSVAAPLAVLAGAPLDIAFICFGFTRFPAAYRLSSAWSGVPFVLTSLGWACQSFGFTAGSHFVDTVWPSPRVLLVPFQVALNFVAMVTTFIVACFAAAAAQLFVEGQGVSDSIALAVLFSFALVAIGTRAAKAERNVDRATTLLPPTAIAAALALVTLARFFFCASADENLDEGAEVPPVCSNDGTVIFVSLVALAVTAFILPDFVGKTIRPKWLPAPPVTPEKQQKKPVAEESVKFAKSPKKPKKK